MKDKKETRRREESFFDTLDMIAQTHYVGYYTTVRDPKEPLTIGGVVPDIVAGITPHMASDDIRIVAMVGTEESLASGLPSDWKRIIDLSKGSRWVVDFFVPRSMIRKVRTWLGDDSEARVIPL